MQRIHSVSTGRTRCGGGHGTSTLRVPDQAQLTNYQRDYGHWNGCSLGGEGRSRRNCAALLCRWHRLQKSSLGEITCAGLWAKPHVQRTLLSVDARLSPLCCLPPIHGRVCVRLHGSNKREYAEKWAEANEEGGQSVETRGQAPHHNMTEGRSSREEGSESGSSFAC